MLKEIVQQCRNAVEPNRKNSSEEKGVREFTRVLADLSYVLYKCYGKRCILLLDEFDTPLASAYKTTSEMDDVAEGRRQYEEMKMILIQILQNALKVCFHRGFSGSVERGLTWSY